VLLLDRHILLRFLGNFAVLLAVLFLFAVALDVILQLDDFVDASRVAVEAGRFTSMPVAVAMAILNFHGPRLFQFFGMMVGLVSIGAMGFTLASMVRSRELVAMMAAGVGLVRVSVVILAGAFLLNLVQVLNGELLVPRLAPLLMRHHDAILRSGVERFEVPLTRERGNALIRAESFDPESGRLEGVLIIERAEGGRALARTAAAGAQWDPTRGGWRLEAGERVGVALTPEDADGLIRRSEPVEFFETELGPRHLLVRRFGQFASMLSIAEIESLRDGAGPELGRLVRASYGRFGQVAVNLLVLLVAMPCFLIRVPGPMLAPAVKVAAIGVVGTLGAITLMTVEIPGIPPALAAFLPAAVLLPIAVARIGSLRS